MTSNRRQFLRDGGFALGTVTAGSVAAEGLDRRLQPQVVSRNLEPNQVAGFGWEVVDIDNNGANVFFQVLNDMTLQSLVVDVAYMITTAPDSAGPAEVLCAAAVARGAPPTFSPGPASYPAFPVTSPFGNVQLVNPNGLHVAFDPGTAGDSLYRVILKTWVPADGTASAASRNVRLEPFLGLNAGDFLVFHLDHFGVPGDVEMQVVLGYARRSIIPPGGAP
jgi:hypothetical protein